MQKDIDTLKRLARVLRSNRLEFSRLDEQYLQELVAAVEYLISDLQLALFWLEIARAATKQREEARVG